MLTAESHRPQDLAEGDVAAWRALCAAHPAFASPLLSPEFAMAVGEVRPDARVAVWRREGRPVGFLAHHRRPGGMARPIGAPLSDYHALVGEGPMDGGEALAAAGVSAYRFTGLIDPFGVFAPHAAGRAEGFVIALEGSAADYLEALRAQSAKRFKNYRRLTSKLEREVGEIVLAAPDVSRGTFETLIAWKRAQLRRTGLHDFLAPDWTRALLANLFERRQGELQGLMIGFYAGGRLLAGQFGVRQGGVFHPWIASTDPQMGAWSPGQLFFLQAIAAMPSAGLAVYDLASGHEHYKRPFALATRTIAEGLATASSSAGRAARVSEAAWAMAGANREGATASLRRRLDVIATTELSLIGRARGLATAIATRTLRGSSDSEAA
ncbi:MAG: GNAT family N-acetyltransferase [Phenylobacterium sp.]|uniref:GNAT family N-acetyltransferase n=1 Tax=Phenylobacterium sp. TaxID=1871053 RepID=UPI00391B1EFB